MEDHVSRMWIDKDIEFSHQTDIPWHTNRPSHNDQATELLHRRWSELDRTRNVRQRSQGNHGQVTPMVLPQLQQTLHGLPARWRLLWGRIIRAAVSMAQGCHPPQAIATVKGRGGMEWTAQWACRTLGDHWPHRWAQHGEHTTYIRRRHLHRDITSDGRNQLDTQLW